MAPATMHDSELRFSGLKGSDPFHNKKIKGTIPKRHPPIEWTFNRNCEPTTLAFCFDCDTLHIGVGWHLRNTLGLCDGNWDLLNTWSAGGRLLSLR